MECSPPGSSVHGTFQARVLEWGAIAFPTVPLYCLVKHLMVLCLATQSWPTLCEPMDCSLPGFSVHRILQARILPSSQGVKHLTKFQI